MDTPAGQKNITRALEVLSPYINSPRRTVIQIEAFVVLAAVLLFLQLILGTWRRRSGHWSIQGALWLSYTLSFPLITYTIGQMASSPVKNGLYPLWVCLLFWAAGSTNSITAYALEDNKQWKRNLFELFQYVFYSTVIISLLDPRIKSGGISYDDVRTGAPSAPPAVFTLLLVLVVVISSANFVRVIAGWSVTNSTSSKIIADYMKDQVNQRDDHVNQRDAQETSDPTITLKNCRYLVKYCVIPGTRKGLTYTTEPTYRTKLSTDAIITVSTIWEQKFDDQNGLKDVCLSFALSRLLARRFYGMECAEADLPETRNFVIKGLLKEEDKSRNYTRAFQIIEVELGFLYDLLFTKYAVLSQLEIPFLFMAVLKLVLISICGVALFRGSFYIRTGKPVIEANTTTFDVTITLMIIGSLWLAEVIQVILYVTSDWATVSLACSYIRGTKHIPSVISWLRRFSFSRTMFGKFLDRLNLFGHWQNKLGQSSVIEGCLHVNPTSMTNVPARYFIDLFIDLYLSVRYSRKTFVVLPDLVKTEIVFCLQEHCKKGGPLTNGKSALSNGNFGEFAWTLSEEDYSQTMSMLIWHIATEYCNLVSSNEAEGGQHREIATTLSRYCAYLMSFLPDLLPGNSADTVFVNHAVLLEARVLLPKREPITREILLEAITKYSSGNNTEDTVEHGSTSNTNQDTIFIKGLRLGIELENKGVRRWKVLTEFWAETIIFIAPSDNATAHMERLAQGGEFLTHVWALLNHAGILKRDQNLTLEDMA